MIKVSVVISVYNGEKDIRECLYSLNNQNFGDFEVIVIDDSSTDQTVEILKGIIKNKKDLGIKYPLKLLKVDHLGPGNARNLGASVSCGDILVFVDADMTFDADFLSNLTLPIRKNLTKGTFSSQEYVSNWENVWSRCLNIEKGWEEKRRHPRNYPDYQEVFRAIKKSEFDKVGGFSIGGYDDDWSLFKKLGYKSKDVKNAVFYHKNPSTLRDVFYQARWSVKRQYKFGFLGETVSLLRSSLPISIVVGLYKSLKNSSLEFFPYKIVYDLGRFLGVLEMMIFKKYAK